MFVDEYHVRADYVSKFFNTLRISGWFYHASDSLASITLGDPHVISATSTVGVPHAGVATLGPKLGFTLQVLRDTDALDLDAQIKFTAKSGWTGSVRLGDLAEEVESKAATSELMAQFQAEMHHLPTASVLDIGGRARSGLARRDLFSVAKYTVLDVLADPSVDVVGDAHTLDRHFPAEQFDGIISVSVFEHLLMPWAVAVQMNRVLKPGGLAMVFTHQTLGMHDLPWDFWRFSDSAWDALFNRHTGFEIVARALDRPQFIIPFAIRPNKEFAERAAGFEGSAVLVRKTGPSQMQWNLAASDVVATAYPE
jgi:hypothetical protein